MAAYRILIVLTPALHPNGGGVQMSTWKLGQCFRGLGNEVAVYSFGCDGHAAPDFGRLFAAPYAGEERNAHNLSGLRNCLEDFRPQIVINQMPYASAITKVVKEFRPQLLLGCLRNTLFSVTANPGAYVRRVVPKFLAPLLQNSVGRRALLAFHIRSHQAELGQILRDYDYFVMFGPPNLEELKFFVPGFDRSKVALIPNSVPQVLIQPPAKDRRILWLGRVEYEQKRADLILPAWKRLMGILPDWELDVVGDGPALMDLKTQAARESIPRVVFHGRQTPDEFYRRSAVFFMTSAFEGFPNTLVEAQSFGAVPVIFDSYPVARWLIKAGRNGFLVKPFDVAGLANAIHSAAVSPDRGKLAQAALDEVRQFEIGNVGAQWEALFDAGLKRHGRVH